MIEEPCVGVQCHRGRRVASYSLDYFDVRTFTDRKAHGGVPKIVEGRAGERVVDCRQPQNDRCVVPPSPCVVPTGISAVLVTDGTDTSQLQSEGWTKVHDNVLTSRR